MKSPTKRKNQIVSFLWGELNKNSWTKLINAYGTKHKPNKEISYQNLTDGPNIERIKKEPPVQNIIAINNVIKALINLVFFEADNEINKNITKLF